MKTRQEGRRKKKETFLKDSLAVSGTKAEKEEKRLHVWDEPEEEEEEDKEEEGNRNTHTEQPNQSWPEGVANC